MNLELYQPVTLRAAFPEYQLTTGQQVMLINSVPPPQRGESGYIVEIFDDSGESIAVVAIPQSSLEPTATLTRPACTTLLESLEPARDRQKLGPGKPLRVSKSSLPKRSPLKVEGIEVTRAEEIVACVQERRER